MSDASRVVNPFALDLDQQRKRARELTRALVAGSPDAATRFQTHHPKAAGLAAGQLRERLGKVTEAQVVVARELGLPSWPALKRHVEQLTRARHEIDSGSAPPDGDVPTIHLRCGSDIRTTLAEAGFEGTFLEYSDPVCQGPVSSGEDLIARRAEFLARYGDPVEAMRERLEREESALRAARTAGRVVLWFEHDPYDQLILARVLASFARHGRPDRLELICVNRFPAVTQFIGLGQLAPAALRMLWAMRTPVTASHLQMGIRVWDALRDPSPEALAQAMTSAGPIAEMGPAIRRHLQELPWTTDGLGLTERLTLQRLAAGPATGGMLFRHLALEADPLPHLGDTMYWDILSEMGRAEVPPWTVDADTSHGDWRDRRLQLNPTGRALASGARDWSTCVPKERWVGGVLAHSAGPGWRWDPHHDRPSR